jgi:hypothetical protein
MRDAELRRAARLRLLARRRRDGKLRLRAVLLSLALFGAFWVLVFAQMVSGHDPVLGRGSRTASTSGQRSGNSPKPKPAHHVSRQPQLAIDPQTGAIVEVPATSAPVPAPAPAPTPVTTSQS